MRILLVCFFICATALCRAEDSLAEHIRYNSEGENRVGYLDIPRDRPIDQSTYLYVKFALEEYIKQGVVFVCLHLDTPGGEVFPSVKIAELLQNLDAQHHIPVVAVIDNWALSAGALLAYSCRYIAISPTALMGAAEPVTAGAEGKIESAPEKIVSALRAEFGTFAKLYGRNPLIATAMVDKDIILIKKGDEVIELKEESDAKAFRKGSYEWVTTRGKLLTLDAEQLIDLKVADFKVESTSLLFSKIPNLSLVNYSDWKIDFFAFLTNPLIASLLMMGLTIGIYMEMSHPGFGIPGMIALACLALILISHFATDLIHWFPRTWSWGKWDIHALEFFERLAYFGGALILSLLFMILFSRYISPRLMKKNKMILQEDQEGSIAGPDISTLPPVGSEGEAFTPLRPGGKVLIKDQFHDATAYLGFIDRGEKVVVVKILGSAIIVAKK